MADSPIKVFPLRNNSDRVLHVRLELWFDGVKRYEVSVQPPQKSLVSKRTSRFVKNFGGGLEILRGPHFYGETGESIPGWNGIDIKKYKAQMISQAWAIIKEGEEKSQASPVTRSSAVLPSRFPK